MPRRPRIPAPSLTSNARRRAGHQVLRRERPAVGCADAHVRLRVADRRADGRLAPLRRGGVVGQGAARAQPERRTICRSTRARLRELGFFELDERRRKPLPPRWKSRRSMRRRRSSRRCPSRCRPRRELSTTADRERGGRRRDADRGRRRRAGDAARRSTKPRRADVLRRSRRLRSRRRDDAEAVRPPRPASWTRRPPPQEVGGSGSLFFVLWCCSASAARSSTCSSSGRSRRHVSVKLATPREVVRALRRRRRGQEGRGADALVRRSRQGHRRGRQGHRGQGRACRSPRSTPTRKIEKELADVKDRARFYEKQLAAAKANNDRGRPRRPRPRWPRSRS